MIMTEIRVLSFSTGPYLRKLFIFRLYREGFDENKWIYYTKGVFLAID
jgi:hypothetical protein